MHGDACDEPRATLLAGISPAEGLDLAGVTFADFTDLFCDETRCWAVRDGILVYRDRSHITNSFARVHAGRLSAAIERVIGLPWIWWFVTDREFNSWKFE